VVARREEARGGGRCNRGGSRRRTEPHCRAGDTQDEHRSRTGTHRQRLTRPTGPNSDVTPEDWSPDGKRLLYQATTYEAVECPSLRYALRSRLITVGRDGSSPRVVTKYGAERAAWSPSSSKIAYLTCAFEGQLPCQVWVVDVTGSNRHRVGPEVNMSSGTGLKWTRGGREIVTPYLCAPGDCVPLANYCQPPTHRRMVVDLAAEVPPLVVSAELLVSQADRPGDFVCVRVDPESLGRRAVIRPFRVFLREGEVLAGVSPPVADQLRGCSLMSPRKYPSELRRLGEDRVGRQPEACEVRRNLRARRGPRVVVRVQEPFRGRDRATSLLLVDPLKIEPPV
jgi:hypothetical protein